MLILGFADTYFLWFEEGATADEIDPETMILGVL